MDRLEKNQDRCHDHAPQNTTADSRQPPDSRIVYDRKNLAVLSPAENGQNAHGERGKNQDSSGHANGGIISWYGKNQPDGKRGKPDGQRGIEQTDRFPEP